MILNTDHGFLKSPSQPQEVRYTVLALEEKGIGKRAVAPYLPDLVEISILLYICGKCDGFVLGDSCQ